MLKPNIETCSFGDDLLSPGMVAKKLCDIVHFSVDDNPAVLNGDKKILKDT